jgi:hypothetical protein
MIEAATIQNPRPDQLPRKVVDQLKAKEAELKNITYGKYRGFRVSLPKQTADQCILCLRELFGDEGIELKRFSAHQTAHKAWVNVHELAIP